MILVIRLPCLPEDEGRAHIVGQYKTLEEASAWVKAQEGEYFSPQDYSIVEVPLERRIHANPDLASKILARLICGIPNDAD